MKLKLAMMIMLGAVICSCRSGTNKSTESDKSGEAVVEFHSSAKVKGTWPSAHQYANAYFGLVIDFPTQWHMDKGGSDAEMQKRIEQLAGDDNEYEAELKRALQESFTIAGISKYPLGSSEKPNATVELIIENITKYPAVKTSEDYLRVVVESFKASPHQIEFVGASQVESFKGVKFATQKVKVDTGNVKVSQKFHILLKGEYVLVISTAYADEQDLKALKSILNTLKKY